MDIRIGDLPEPTNTEAALAAVVALRRTADRLELASVQCAIDKGWTWAEIATALGVTKQAVHKRYARRVKPRKKPSGRSPEPQAPTNTESRP